MDKLNKPLKKMMDRYLDNDSIYNSQVEKFFTRRNKTFKLIFAILVNLHISQVF